MKKSDPHFENGQRLPDAAGHQFAPTNRNKVKALASGFTLIDVLVSIAVIAVLIGLLIPSLSSVNETARRVICQSNVRQIGIGLIHYANDYKGQLPVSRYIASANNPARSSSSPEKMVTVRVGIAESENAMSNWDGLGLLFATDYIPAPKIFYCPSHRGDHPYSAYATGWGGSSEQEIVANFHFRGEGPTTVGRTVNGLRPTTQSLWNIDPAQSSLIADGMQVKSDYNHKVGVNFFRADLSVHWFADPNSRLQELLPDVKNNATPQTVREAWSFLDASVNVDR